MDAKPKRRWYQFSMRTLWVMMTMLGFGLGMVVIWLQHRQFCYTQIYQHMDNVAIDGGYFRQLMYCDESFSPEEMRELKEVNEHRDHIAHSYERAIYRPWERLWIGGPEPRPPQRPERFTERFKSSRDPKSLLQRATK